MTSSLAAAPVERQTAILKAVEAGQTIKDVCRENEVSEATYYNYSRDQFLKRGNTET